MGGIGPLMWILMGVFWIALLGLIAFLIVRLLPRSGDGTGHRSASNAPVDRVGNESAEQVLDRLFAMGEIDEQTYRSRRTALAEMRRAS
jgi:putative membrane protein